MTIQLMDKQLQNYAEAHTSKEDEVLTALNRTTAAKVQMPQMLSGHLQGALLKMISHMARPGHILEIGTYTGYSAICLAQGLRSGGRLITIDINEELEDMCREYWVKAGVMDRIDMHIGNALNIIPELNVEFDLVFIDADKKNYSNYFDLVIDKVSSGGFIIADNVLYDGEVVLPEEEQSGNARAMDAFNKKMMDDNRIEHVLLPVRDGLMVCRKL